MSAHTPGPWREEQHRHSRLIETDDAVIADVFDFGGELSSESNANARLIAAAPDMLAAAKEAEALLRGIEGMSRNNIEEMAVEVGDTLRAAIAKATGEPA